LVVTIKDYNLGGQKTGPRHGAGQPIRCYPIVQ
jgi:hypothetical protein